MSQTRNNNTKQLPYHPAFGFPVQRGQEKPSTPPIQAPHEYNRYPSYEFSVPQLQIQQASSGIPPSYVDDLSAPLLKLSISDAGAHQAAGEPQQMKGLLSSQLEETRRSPTAGVHELSPRFDAVVRDQRRTPDPIGTIGKKSPMPQSSLEVPPPAYGKGLSLSPPNTVTLFQSSSHKSAQFIRSISPSTLQPSPMISPSTSPHRLSPFDPNSARRSYESDDEPGFNEEFLNGMGGMDDVDDRIAFRAPPLLTPHKQVPAGVVAPMPIKRPSPTSVGSFGSGSLENQFDMNNITFSYGYSNMEFAPQEDSVFQKPSSAPHSEIDASFLSSPSGASQDPSNGTYLEHPLGEHPSRTLFVRNISSNVDDEQLKDLFGSYGPIRSLYTQCKHRGFVMISYYDIRHAKNAMKNLQHKIINRRKIDIHYSIPKENPSEKDLNQGTLVVFNLDPSITNEELKKVFGKFGEIKEIRETPNKKHHKFIEFYDVRDAERAMKHLNKTELKGKKIKIEPSRPGGARRNIQEGSSSTSSPVLESNLSESPSMMTMPIISSSPSYTHFGSPVQLIQKPALSLLSMVHQQQMQLMQHNPIISGSPILEQFSSSHGTLFGNQMQGQQQHPMFQGTPPTSRFASSLPSSLSSATPTMNSVNAGSFTSTQPFTISPVRTSPTVTVARSPPAASSSSAPIVSAEPAAAEPPAERTKQRKGNSDKKLFSVDLERVRNGDDKRTTLMIKNIPNKYTQKMLLQTIEIKFKATFDFFYLPIDFKNKCNVGYAFINFINPINIVPFSEEFHGKKWEKFNSEKICEITYARIQGKTALISHFQNSSLMVEDPSCRPIFI